MGELIRQETRLAGIADLVASDSVVQTLEEAMNWRGSGEAILRRGSRVARLFFCNGRVAWVDMTPRSPGGGLLAELTSAAEISESDLHIAVDECRRTGCCLYDFLVAAGLIARESLRRIVAGHIGRKLQCVASMNPDTAIFVPLEKRCETDLLFDFGELFGETEIL